MTAKHMRSSVRCENESVKSIGTAFLILIVVASCTSRRERQARQAELQAHVEKQTEENSHPSIEPHQTETSLNDKVSVTLLRIDDSTGGMKTFVVTVTNDSAIPIKRINGQVVIKTERGQEFQLGYDVPMKIAPHSSQEYRMPVEPRWEQTDRQDTARETKFYITNVEPDP
jgi:hypothetical protein